MPVFNKISWIMKREYGFMVTPKGVLMTNIPRYGNRTPAKAASHVRPRRKNLMETRRLSGTQGSIVSAARKLIERNGVHATTVTAIAEEANVTRELVYYHFQNKNGVIEALLDDYVEDLVESVITWNEERTFGDIAGSLKKCIRTFRYVLYDAKGKPRPMIHVLEELGVRDAFGVRAAQETVDCFSDHIVTEYAAHHQIEIDLVYEMLCVTIYGLVGLAKIKPSVSDEELMKIVEQTLRLDMGMIEEAGSKREATPNASEA